MIVIVMYLCGTIVMLTSGIHHGRVGQVLHIGGPSIGCATCRRAQQVFICPYQSFGHKFYDVMQDLGRAAAVAHQVVRNRRT